MKNKLLKPTIYTLILVLSLLLSGCGMLGPILDVVDAIGESESSVTPATEPTPVPPAEPETIGDLESIQAGFSSVYAQVLPSVVNIQVVKTMERGLIPDNKDIPFPFPFQLPDNNGEFRSSGLGSGFVWDQKGHIVTNNHVVENADKIKVTFSDGTSVEGEIVGTDRDSDLAVVKVNYPEDQLQPIQIADSTQVIVGQLVAAIGNPFGLEGTMTVGIVSALGRSLPVSQFQGSSYAIPDVIQTDAPINPGNSGGVLVDIRGQLIGVPTAIESSSGVNAGIGFVVPSVIVQKVVPVLIDQGFYEHPWIGISGTTLNSDVAEKMGLERDQRGALVIDIVPDSPAEKANLVGSDRVVSIDGQDYRVGGDVIIQIDTQPVGDFEDLTAYLARHTETGQTVTLTIFRDGKQESLELTLGVRPKDKQIEIADEDKSSGDVWLGISGVTMSPKIAEEMDLPSDQAGVLVQQVIEKSPADQAGFRGSYKSIMLDGEQILVGGDVIVSIDNKNIESIQELQTTVHNHKSGDEILVSILRDKKQIEINVTLREKP